MYAVEFQTVIKNGMIEIPKLYQADMPSRVRVIILADSSEHKNENIIDRLMKSPRKVGNFSPMKREEIYDRS
jgi:hypothetical protein